MSSDVSLLASTAAIWTVSKTAVSRAKLLCGVIGRGLAVGASLQDVMLHFCHGPPGWSIPPSNFPVAGVFLLSGVGAWPPPDGVG
jgi:hypothetical protein